MTFLLFAFGIGLVGATVRLLVHAAVLPRLRLSLHLRKIQGYGFESSAAPGGIDSRKRLNEQITSLVRGLGGVMMRHVPALTPLRRGELTAAGYYDLGVEVIHGYRTILAVLLPGLIGFLVLSGGGLSLITMLMIAGAGLVGWYLPAIVIRSKGKTRMFAVDRELPELIDLLTATVEAGMGFAGSVSLVANRFKGPLGDELRLTLRQQTLGISNEDALNDMVERCDTPSVRAFVRTVTRAEQLGGSIGPILRELAADVRRRRRQSAEEKMQKAPVKMLFPLMLLIFPALMIELMYPAAYSLLHSF